MKITRLDDKKILYYEFDEKSHANTNKIGRSDTCESNSGTPPNYLISTQQDNLESLGCRTQRYCTG